ncbi:MAG: glycosyltransferase family 2 protein [Lachnospiraceae bacterium]|nr:glycosyltransferase family 2 protein [Lachnospiraceae bacterium]
MGKLMRYMEELKKCIEGISCKDKKFVIAVEEGFFISEDINTDIEKLCSDDKLIGDAELTLDKLSDYDGAIVLFVSDEYYHGKLSELINGVTLSSKEIYFLTDLVNSGHINYVMRLLSGDGCEINSHNLYTPRYVDYLMTKKGYSLCSSYDVKSDDILGENYEGGYSYLRDENSLVCEYVAKVKNTLDDASDVARIIRLYKLDNKSEQLVTDQECFMSIIMRTQGKRKIELEEALLSVYGQTDDDYEILLMGHNLDEAGKENVEQIISDTPAELRKRIRYIDVVGGTRTTPLIRGFEEARGEYVSILDDDDIVFDNWIEEFHKLAKDNHGKILHAYCARQDWLRIDNPYGGDGLRATDTFEKLYCRDFNPIGQLSTNTCPIHSLAFPISAYGKLGIRFDESLNVVEDWDFLMRTSFITGVANTDSITSIYRIWKNTENSAALHSQAEWDKTRRDIIDKFDDTIMLMPKESAGKIVDLIESGTVQRVSASAEISKLWTFFVDTVENAGFSTECMLHDYIATKEDGRFIVRYEDLSKFGSVRTVRLDPSEDAGITVESIRVTVKYADGSSKDVDVSELTGNSLLLEDKLIFPMPDPQIIYVEKDEKDIVEVEISGRIFYDFDNDTKIYMGELLKQYKDIAEQPGLLNKIKRKIINGKK